MTVQDLLDAQARGELTRTIMADMAGFKIGHCNRLERALVKYGGSGGDVSEGSSSHESGAGSGSGVGVGAGTEGSAGGVENKPRPLVVERPLL